MACSHTRPRAQSCGTSRTPNRRPAAASPPASTILLARTAVCGHTLRRCPCLRVREVRRNRLTVLLSERFFARTAVHTPNHPTHPTIRFLMDAAQ